MPDARNAWLGASDEVQRRADVEEALAAGRRSLEDIRLGRVVPAEDVIARMQAKITAYEEENGRGRDARRDSGLE